MRLTKGISSNVESQIRDMYFVGRLATKEDLAGTMLLPVSFQNEYKEYIQFQIKCLSEIPHEISDTFSYSNKVFTGSTRSRTNQRLFQNILDDKILSENEKKEKIKDELEKKLLLFKMTITSAQDYVYIDLVNWNEVSHFENEYVLIPSPQLNVGEQRMNFEEKLLSKLRPFVLSFYPSLFKEPEFIYIDGRLYSNFSLNNTFNPTTYTQKSEAEIEYLDEEECKFMDNVVMSYKNGLFVVPLKYVFNLRDIKGKLLLTAFEHEEKELKRKKLPLEEQPNTEELRSDKEDQINPRMEDETERLFLEKLQENALNQGLIYSPEDLYNFHTCVKTNLLTIIGGMSGIGKSRLALLYAESLGLNFGKEVLMIPVSPAYSEPNDVLGYLNPSTGVYNESETGLVKLLMDAEAESSSKSDSKLYMVIFDEMNLAQVEHWFSPFISLLEMGEEKRYLTLFNENSHCINKYKSKIKIGDNIIFIGTVNFDETTKLFSDRLLDRANIFVPEKNTLENFYANYFGTENNKIEPVHCTRDTFRKWVKDSKLPETLSLNKEEIEILDEINRLLHSQDRQKGVSFRTALSIAKFLNNIPKDVADNTYIDRKTAFDLQINQRIITKIRGLDSFVRPLVGTVNGDEYIPGKIGEFLSSPKVQEFYHFKKSLEILEYKAKELIYYGFAN